MIFLSREGGEDYICSQRDEAESYRNNDSGFRKQIQGRRIETLTLSGGPVPFFFVETSKPVEQEIDKWKEGMGSTRVANSLQHRNGLENILPNG